jgi:hypothetical protein
VHFRAAAMVETNGNESREHENVGQSNDHERPRIGIRATRVPSIPGTAYSGQKTQDNHDREEHGARDTPRATRGGLHQRPAAGIRRQISDRYIRGGNAYSHTERHGLAGPNLGSSTHGD